MSAGHFMECPAYGVTFIAERLRRERQELMGELTVRCTLPGAVTIKGVISTCDFNFSSLRARQERAKHLADRAHTNGKLDWYGFLEEFCQQVFDVERSGSPSVDLRTIPKADRTELYLDGLPVPRRHPTILFGDGGTSKSLLALWWASWLVTREKLKVGLFDWELSGEDHRDRLEGLFGEMMPRIEYCRCDIPLVHDIDRIVKVVRDSQLDYAIFDSIAMACDGPPEAAEIAAKYFRALRQLTIGTLHIAHITKAENGDRRPFGSAFWHNLARSTWFIKSESRDGHETEFQVALHHRKSNLSRISKPLSYRMQFDRDQIFISRAQVADSEELAQDMSLPLRMHHLLQRGAMDPEAIAEELGANIDTVKRYARPKKDRPSRKQQFILLDGGKIGLFQP